MIPERPPFISVISLLRRYSSFGGSESVQEKKPENKGCKPKKVSQSDTEVSQNGTHARNGIETTNIICQPGAVSPLDYSRPSTSDLNWPERAKMECYLTLN